MIKRGAQPIKQLTFNYQYRCKRFEKYSLKKNSSVVGFALGGAGPCLVSKTFDFFYI